MHGLTSSEDEAPPPRAPVRAKKRDILDDSSSDDDETPPPRAPVRAKKKKKKRCLSDSSSDDDATPPPRAPVRAKKKKKKKRCLSDSSSDDDAAPPPGRPLARKTTPASAAPSRRPSSPIDLREDEPSPLPVTVDLTHDSDDDADATVEMRGSVQQLVSMGFSDAESARALASSNGDVAAAIAVLTAPDVTLGSPDRTISCSLPDSTGKERVLDVRYYSDALDAEASRRLYERLARPASSGGEGLGPERRSYYVGNTENDQARRPWRGPDATETNLQIRAIGEQLAVRLGFHRSCFTHAVVQMQGPDRRLKDGIGNHTDRDLDPSAPIVGLSLFHQQNTTRPITLAPGKDYTGERVEHDLELADGSAYALMPPTNEWWQHGLRPRACLRISITFRREPEFGTRPGSKIVESFTYERRGTFYEVTPDMCTCPSYKYKPCPWKDHFRCKHMEYYFPIKKAKRTATRSKKKKKKRTSKKKTASRK